MVGTGAAQSTKGASRSGAAAEISLPIRAAHANNRRMTNGAQMWDDRFGSGPAPYGTEPSLYLKEKASLWRPGQRALVPADGGGRNGVWLAEQGLDVLSVDFSDRALQRARDLAVARGVTLRTEQADLVAWTWPEAAFDLVASVYFHLPPAVRARIHGAMVRAVRPGGHVLVEAFAVEQMGYASGGPRDPDMLLTEQRLRSDFAGADVLEVRRDLVQLDEGPFHRGPGMLMRLLARRPAEGQASRAR